MFGAQTRPDFKFAIPGTQMPTATTLDLRRAAASSNRRTCRTISSPTASLPRDSSCTLRLLSIRPSTANSAAANFVPPKSSAMTACDFTERIHHRGHGEHREEIEKCKLKTVKCKLPNRQFAICKQIHSVSPGPWWCGLKQAIEQQPHFPHLGPMIEALDRGHMH